MIYPDVKDITATQLQRLREEYRANNHIDPKLAEKLDVKRGLRNADGTGVLAGLTNICDVIGYVRDKDGNPIPAEGKLLFRGIDLTSIIDEAIKNDRFLYEEVVWLLLMGALPNKEHLTKFRELLESHRELPEGFAVTQIMSAPSPNIMNKIARSVLAMYSYDENAEDSSLGNIIKQSVNLIAEMPTLMVYAYQTMLHVYRHQSQYFHYPKAGLSTAEHILATYRPDQNFTHEEAKLLDLCMVVHADHGGGNNSAFTTRVVSSTGSDTYSAIASSVLSLKGSKHGGANLRVMHQLDDMLENVGNVENDEEVKCYLRKIMKKEAGDGTGLIYGMGHAIYTKSDPRAQILKKHAKKLAKENGFEKEYIALCQIEKLTPCVFEEIKGRKKEICANVDLFSGLVYRILGIAEELYTPIFAISRVAGWCAHRLEEIEFSNRIIRPAYKYVGSAIEYVELEKRR